LFTVILVQLHSSSHTRSLSHSPPLPVALAPAPSHIRPRSQSQSLALAHARANAPSESALFSNIAAMTLSASDAPNLSEDKKPGILNLGRRAVWATMQMDEFLTVGIVSKSCKRLDHRFFVVALLRRRLGLRLGRRCTTSSI
jgi:hypothetical protein